VRRTVENILIDTNLCRELSLSPTTIKEGFVYRARDFALAANADSDVTLSHTKLGQNCYDLIPFFAKVSS
jgi:hypothetical protein